MRRFRVGTFSMGILLILVGVLLLLDRFKIISSIKFIINWWPIILIILGIEILVYIYFSKENEPKVKYDGFSIFIIIILMLFSTGAYIVTGLFDNVPEIKDLSVFGYYKYESTFDKEMIITLDSLKSLSIINNKGNITIRPSSKDNIELKASVFMRNNDEDYARNMMDSIIEVKKDKKIYISINDLVNTKIQNINVNIEIYVPENLIIEAENMYGKISVEDLNSSININSESSNIFARNIKGNLIINNIYGNVEVVNSNKNIQIDNENGNVKFESTEAIKENLTIKNNYGDIYLNIPETQEAIVTMKTKYGEIYSDLPVETSETESKVNKVIGNDKVKINLEANNGNIYN
ncbi:MAG: DUF4097 family beta strand repeat-containing protein [Clostridiaceae bacterium]